MIEAHSIRISLSIKWQVGHSTGNRCAQNGFDRKQNLHRSKERTMLDVRIAGYDYGKVAHSPLTLDDMNRLQQTVGFTEEDRRALTEASEILEDEAESL